GTTLLCLLRVLSSSRLYFPSTSAQTQNTGAIQGRVFDGGSLDPLPSVVVTVTHEEIGLERTTVSNDEGIYYVGILPAGRYRITAQKQGYENDSDPRNSIINNFLIHITNTERADQPPPIILRRAGASAPPPVTPPPATRPPATQPRPTPPPAAQPTTLPPTRPASTTDESNVALLANTSNATRGGNFDERFLLSLPLPGVRS